MPIAIRVAATLRVAPISPCRVDSLVRELAATVDAMRIRLKQSIEGLEAERNRLRRLFERLHEGIIAVDSGLNVTMVNGAAADMLEMHSLRDGDPLPDFEPELRLRGFAAKLFEPGASFGP